MIVKPGYKTTELLASLAAAVSSWLFEWQGSLSPRWAAIVTAIAAGSYTLSRGLVKLGAYVGGVPGVQPAPPAPAAPPTPAATVGP